MNDAVLIQQCYQDDEYREMLEIQRERNEQYCQAHGFDYLPYVGNPVPAHDYHLGAWAKIKLMLDAVESGYRYIVWLDTDALIYDLGADLRDGCPSGIGLCWHRIPQLHHWNVGAMYLQGVPGLLDFLCAWLEQYPPPPDGWNEQGVFNRMAMKSKLVHTISDKWNATLNVNMVPDVVVLGFHGAGNPKERLALMRCTLEKIA